MPSVSETASELGYVHHDNGHTVRLELFSPHDTALNLEVDSHVRLAHIDKVTYGEALLSIVEESGIEQAEDAEGKFLFGYIQLTKSGALDAKFNPMRNFYHTARVSESYIHYEVEKNDPRQDVIEVRLVDKTGQTIVAYYNCVDQHIEIVFQPDTGSVSHDDLRTFCLVYADLHDAIAKACYGYNYEYAVKPIPLTIGKTDVGSISDIQLALLLEIGKVNSGRGAHPIRFSPDIIGANIDVMSDITDIDYELVAKRLLAEKAAEHPDTSYTLTHLDLLRAIQKAA